MDPVTLKLAAEPLIMAALREDMNAGDLSTEAVMPERGAPRHGRAHCQTGRRD